MEQTVNTFYDPWLSCSDTIQQRDIFTDNQRTGAFATTSA